MKKIVVLLLLIAIAAGGYMFLSQKQNTNMDQHIAPVHSDDVANSETVKPDIVLAASEHIVGRWISDIDRKSTREYISDGTLMERYDGRELSRGTWKAFTAEKPVEGVSIDLEADTVYIQETLVNEVETTNYTFRVSQLTWQFLELTYMESPGRLNFYKALLYGN